MTLAVKEEPHHEVRKLALGGLGKRRLSLAKPAHDDSAALGQVGLIGNRQRPAVRGSRRQREGQGSAGSRVGRQGGGKRRRGGTGAGKVHEQQGFEGIWMTVGEFKSRRPAGSRAGKVEPLHLENVEKGRQQVDGRSRLARFVGDGMTELAEEGHVGQPAGDALGAGKQDEGKTVPGGLVGKSENRPEVAGVACRFPASVPRPFLGTWQVPGSTASVSKLRRRAAASLTRTSAIPIRRRTRASRALRAQR